MFFKIVSFSKNYAFLKKFIIKIINNLFDRLKSQSTL